MLALGGVSDKVRDIPAQIMPNGPSQPLVLWLCNVKTLLCLCVAVLVVALGLLGRSSLAQDGSVSLYGRDGVIMIDGQGNLVWDGLWHSKLSHNNDHVGTYNWALAVDPLLVHTGPVRRALVVGLGSGITAATLAKDKQIEHIDVYEINQTLKEILRLYPQGTLHVAENRKIRIIWQDGRSGVALRDWKYDLITQQPLYLKQAGSSILLSVEYFQLVSRRLADNGIFCVYANGTPEQALAVRQTASAVFPCMLVLHKGCTLLLSKTQLDLLPARLETLLSQKDELRNEIRNFRTMIGEDGWRRYIEASQLPLADSQVTIRDDLPLVEYPVQLRKRLDTMGFNATLPQPGLALNFHKEITASR
jgi:spermidine synthase